MAITDKAFHQMTRTVLQEALDTRSYATSSDLDQVWRHARRTMRAASSLLTYMEKQYPPSDEGSKAPHEAQGGSSREFTDRKADQA